ncbi:zinc finger protein 98-like [Pararge aegeria]|uniref:Jg14282 protein n=2 Tax=Pararge aegeria TaxID=116150 RepID=A0A8S4RU28_9NEOP|nr:zinc finger protein 98-like [Pararge aegeria]CAH2240296.1 jg14282 [Pararge aegeria aegeria]
MDNCRICLTKTVEKDISELSEELNGDKKSFSDIMLFCLNIQIPQETKLTRKLCDKCFTKIISFHEFKTLALKNDEYLRCLQNEEDKVFTVFNIDNIKCEEISNGQSDELFCDMEPLGKIEYQIKSENDVDNVPSDEELLSVIKKIKYEFVSEECKENKERIKNLRKKGKCKKERNKKKNKEPEQREKICEECGKSVINILDHMKLHRPAAERKRINCKVCNKTFASHSARYRHNKVKHLGIKDHCNKCGKDVVSLRSHTLLMHSKANLPFECVPCGRRFISQSSLDVHMLRHTKNRPFVCELCDKDFQQNIGLVHHKRRVHDKERTHMCQICSKRFFRKYNLQLHLRSHSKEKPYKCPDCDKCFSSSTIMKSHQLIHSDAKNFVCDLCDMAFKKPGYLRVHMISHTKVKRYSCAYCDMPFGRSDHRARHERTAHQRPFIQTQENAQTKPKKQ